MGANTSNERAITALKNRLVLLVDANSKINLCKLGTVTVNQEDGDFHINDTECLKAVKRYIIDEIPTIKRRLQDLGVDTNHLEL